MNQTTRNAPFGTDDTPSMTVKIVGGKRVQIAVDPNKKHNNKAYNGGFLDVGPSGTPAILTQPNWDAYDAPTPKISGINQSDDKRKISSYTSPNGDRSYSFKHGVPSAHPRMLLPPYTTKSADPLIQPRRSPTQADEKFESTSLAAHIGQQLQDYTLQNLKDMYIDLTTFDRQLTGMVGEAQFSVIALRHNLPLKLSLLKLVFAKYIDVRDPGLINYEKILQYFSDCIADGQQTIPDALPHRPMSMPSNIVATSYDQSPKIGNINSSQREDDKLVELIQAQLAANEMLELNGFQKSLQDLDRSSTNILPMDAIQSACVKNNLPLPMSLILKLLKRAETDFGKANWIKFMEPLIHANEIRLQKARYDGGEIKGHSSVMDNPVKEPARISRNEQTHPVLKRETSLVSSWKQKISERIGQSAFSHVSEPNSEFGVYSGLPSPPSTTSSLERELSRLSDGWDEKERLKGTVSSPQNKDTFSNKLNKLEEMLRSYNPSNEDILAASDAERITKNFNLIYKLGLSENGINNAVIRSIISKKGTSSREELSVSKLLAALAIDQGSSG